MCNRKYHLGVFSLIGAQNIFAFTYVQLESLSKEK